MNLNHSILIYNMILRIYYVRLHVHHCIWICSRNKLVRICTNDRQQRRGDAKDAPVAVVLLLASEGATGRQRLNEARA